MSAFSGIVDAIKSSLSFLAQVRQVSFIIMAKPLVVKRIERQRYIIEIMCLMPISQVTGKMYSYGEIDQVLTENDIDLATLHLALAAGYPTVTSSLFYAKLDQQALQKCLK